MSTILAPRGRGIKLCLKMLCHLWLFFVALCNSCIILLVFILIKNMLSFRDIMHTKIVITCVKVAVFLEIILNKSGNKLGFLSFSTKMSILMNGKM